MQERQLPIRVAYKIRSELFFFSSRRRHTRLTCDWSSTCALPIFDAARVDAGDRQQLAAAVDERDVARADGAAHAHAWRIEAPTHVELGVDAGLQVASNGNVGLELRDRKSVV